MGSVRKSREEWKVYGNVFSQTSLRLLFKLASQGYFKEIISPVSMGKEANIFTAITDDGTHIIVKMYRLENCNFNKMYDYIIQDNRYLTLKKSKRDTVYAWVQREYRNLLLARDHISVPTPLAVKENIILMGFIGKDDPAPKIKDLRPKNPQKFFDEVIASVQKLAHAGLVHGDLSEYNILNDNEKPVFIDFSQSTVTQSGSAAELMRRDITNVCNFFRKLGVKSDPEQIAANVMKNVRKQKE